MSRSSILAELAQTLGVGTAAGNLVTHDVGGLLGGIPTGTTVSTASGVTADVTSITATANRIIVTLNSVFDRVRLTTVNGTDTFDADSMTVTWES